ncbi:hypothetical protein [Paraburkholderia graminis]|uniref:Uncharacterized protein n=1 Tax=Paraburkholderia graminis TaxID=60548 RepID=A0ABD5CE76_9BURK|nr:hypothetical protein [Paraburkholderia graminis]MDR6203253.1 hypothetical protein [Paraburkholderia graminis]
MSKCENLDEIADVLGDGGPHGPDESFETVEQLVDALVDLGNTDKVFVRHDDHLGLKSGLSEAFLASPLDEVDEEKFEEEIKEVLAQANTIIALSERHLSDDDLEEIREDRESRGEDTDD